MIAANRKAPATRKISLFVVPVPSKERLDTLSDGVFAVAMTLLVLDIKLPALPGAGGEPLWTAFVALWPKVGAFVISFFLLARCWDTHRFVFHVVERADRILVNLNFLFLLFVCFFPFTTALISEYPHSSLAAAAYAADLVVVAALFYVMWNYATRDCRLVAKDTPPALIAWGRRRFGGFTGAYFLALPIAYFSSELAILWIFLCMLTMILLPILLGHDR
jgi:uncharacterized membrane protein